jgi:RNA polymerase sigma-70 factor (ECF subfamily)
VLLLLDGEGWSVKEIAARIGWTTANVKVRAFRARRRLRRLLENAP